MRLAEAPTPAPVSRTVAMERLDISVDEWGNLTRAFSERTLFQTPAWLRYLAETLNAEPQFAALTCGGDVVGYFAGLLIRKLGMKILGSPFAGWGTPYMGFVVQPGISRRDALPALRDFAFRQLGCVHLELMDRQLTSADVQDFPCEQTAYGGFEINLAHSEDELLARMTRQCRQNLRRAEKLLTIEVSHDASFVEDFYPQLREVFGKQGLTPTYPQRRVLDLIRHLEPTGMLLLQRALDDNGRCVATSIMLGGGHTAYMWALTSWRERQILRPNELLIWSGMRYWKWRGALAFDMGGPGEYKRKYGGREISVPWVRVSRHAYISRLRDAAYALFRFGQRFGAGRPAANRKPHLPTGEQESEVLQ